MNKLKQLVTLFVVQLKLQLKIKLRYLSATITEMIIYAGALLLILFGANGNNIGQQYGIKGNILITLIGYLFWSNGVSALNSCSSSVESDEISGIFETEAQSALPLWLIYLVQTIVEELYTWIYLIIISIVTSFFGHFSLLDLCIAFLLTFVFTLISNLGMFGIGMIFASGSIHYKRMGQWATILQALLVMFSNIYQPMITPYQQIIPYASGIEIVRSLFIGKSVPLSTYLIFVVVNLFWLIVGIVIFNYCFKKEKKNGSFDAF